MKGLARDPVRDDEEDRYALYRVRKIVNGGGEFEHHRMCETSRDGIGLALLTMHDEGEYDPTKDRVGIFDKIERRWVANPFIR